MTDKLEKALQDQKQQTERFNQTISGLLGIPLGGQKRVEVSGRNSYVYVRLRSNQSEVIQAYNNKVSPSYNLPVLVERQGNKYIVLGVDSQRYENNWNSQSPFLPRHGNTHSFDIESGGGGDIVWVYPRQITPALVMPSGSSGADSVIVNPYTLQKSDGTWLQVGNTGTSSLSPYVPITGAIMALVYLDTTSGNPMLLINSGTVFSNTITGSSQIPPYVPTVPNLATQIPLAAIRLITGTSVISWDNIYDVRQWLQTIPTGTGGVPPNTYVPYTGATQNVNLGNKNLIATGTTTLAETNISEGSSLQIGSTSAKPTTSMVKFGDSGYVRIFEKYDDSLAIGIYGDDSEIFRAGYNQAYDNLEFLLGDLQGYFHGLYLSICSSGTVIGSTLSPQNNAFFTPSGTVFVNGLWLRDAVYEDLNFDPDSSGGNPTTLPDFVELNGVVYREFTSANNQRCGSVKELPHSYKLGGLLYPHAHVFLKDGEATGTAGAEFTMNWEIRQSSGISSGTVILNATTTQLNENRSRVDIHFPTGYAGATELGAQVAVRIARTGGNAGDVIVTTYGIHYPVDTIGSRQVSSK